MRLPLLLRATLAVAPACCPAAGAAEDFYAGKLSLPIDRRFPLDQAVEAQAHMRENKHFGKILLTT